MFATFPVRRRLLFPFAKERKKSKIFPAAQIEKRKFSFSIHNWVFFSKFNPKIEKAINSKVVDIERKLLEGGKVDGRKKNPRARMFIARQIKCWFFPSSLLFSLLHPLEHLTYRIDKEIGLESKALLLFTDGNSEIWNRFPTVIYWMSHRYLLL